MRAAVDRFIECVIRWQGMRHEDRDVCPFCGGLIVIEPGDDVSHYSHREPVCGPWVPALTAIGGYDARMVTRRVNRA